MTTASGHFWPFLAIFQNVPEVQNLRKNTGIPAFSDFAATDIMTVSRPAMCVTDALIVGEGDGPIANQPRWCGCILASTDPVATDVAICRLLGHDWRKLNF